jgi:trimeric autotransporter adhesin
LPTITDPVNIDGTSPSVIRLYGDLAGGGANGLVINTANSIVEGLSIVGFDGAGVKLAGKAASNNLIRETVLRGNRNGVLLEAGAHHNMVGTPRTTCPYYAETITYACNVISGNRDHGILITGSSTNSNTVQTNYIGTNVSGDQSEFYAQQVGVATADGARYNTIGGASAAARNLISGNSGPAVSIFGAGTSDNAVQGNYIGTNAAGSKALGNAAGVVVSGAVATKIGGTTASERNIISGNTDAGVWSDGGTVSVQSNYIGTDVSGASAIGNGIGVVIDAAYNTVGATNGAPVLAGNVISGNGVGVVVEESAAIVRGNLIGTDASGTKSLPNAGDGVQLVAATATIGGTTGGLGNRISFNKGGGVAVYAGGSSAIRGNAISGNDKLGIDLVEVVEVSQRLPYPVPALLRCTRLYSAPGTPAANDAGDADTGANSLQNYPILSSVVAGPSTNVSGTLNSAANTAFALDFYRSTTPDPTLYGEGEAYVGSISITADASNVATFVATFTGDFATEFFTATATDPAGNTSELGRAMAATAEIPSS